MFRKFHAPRLWREAVRFQKTLQPNRLPPLLPSAVGDKYFFCPVRARNDQVAAARTDQPCSDSQFLVAWLRAPFLSRGRCPSELDGIQHTWRNLYLRTSQLPAPL